MWKVDEVVKYTVRIEENSHYADESARRTLGEFVDAEVAVCAARKVIDEDLNSLYSPGMTTHELYRHYVSFGHDAYIISDDQDCRFSARDYARERCPQICSQPPHTDHNT